MLNEMSRPEHEGAFLADRLATPVIPSAVLRQNEQQAQLRRAVAEVLDIRSEDFSPDRMPGIAAVFTGRLLLDSETAYDTLDTALAALGHTAIFREEGGDHVIQLAEVRFEPKPRAWWPNLVLFVLTLLSLLYVGAQVALEAPLTEPLQLLQGWPYAVSLVLILGAHELGHYFAARYHGVPVTLPYFIPLPFSFFGTMGAFIQLRAPMRNRKVLFDVGIAGPLAGLIFAVPILMMGLFMAEVQMMPQDQPYILEGNSLFYAFAKILTFGEFYPQGQYDIIMNQLVMAGWTGLFVTGLNLMPIGQLDGGHIIYTLLGERARYLYFPAMLIISLMVVFVSEAWLFWLFLLLLFGRVHAAPLDMITPLDRRRWWLGIIALVIFVLVFVPDPIQLIQPAGVTAPVQTF